MKTFVQLLLISVYSLSSFGIGINSLYCCGKFKSVKVSFLTPSKTECNKNHTDGRRCCDNKYKHFKVDDSHMAADHVALPDTYFIAVLPSQTIFATQPFVWQKLASYHYAHAPPLIRTIPIYIANCTYLI